MPVWRAFPLIRPLFFGGAEAGWFFSYCFSNRSKRLRGAEDVDAVGAATEPFSESAGAVLDIFLNGNGTLGAAAGGFEDEREMGVILDCLGTLGPGGAESSTSPSSGDEVRGRLIARAPSGDCDACRLRDGVETMAY